MFDRACLRSRFRYKFKDEQLAGAAAASSSAPTTTLGSETLRTLLMLVMRNATTDSPWPVCNNPHAKYNDRSDRIAT